MSHLLSTGDERLTGTLEHIDWSLFHSVNAAVATRDWLEDPATALGSLAVPLYAAATIALWLLARPYGEAKWKLACTAALSSAALAMIANQVISHVWDRPRPYVAHPGLTHLLSSASPDPSFPSDHAAAAFAIAFAVLAFSRKAGIGFLLAATVIGLSRVALGLHYPSDVLAGILVGWGAAMLVTRLATPLLARIVSIVSRVTDPLLDPVWKRLVPKPRERPAAR